MARLPTLAILMAATGCTTATAPVPNDARAVNTGEYPTFAATPAAANVQLGDDEALAEIARLVRAGDNASVRAGMPMSDADRIALEGDAAVRRAMVGMSEVERLRFLRAVHERRTIERIEGRTS